jgi:hypothetical protein
MTDSGSGIKQEKGTLFFLGFGFSILEPFNDGLSILPNLRIFVASL